MGLFPAPPLTQVALVRARHMVWAAALGTLVIGTELYGTPHLRLSADRLGPDADPFYTRCDYAGLSRFTIDPADGACPLILFRHAEVPHG